MNKVCVKYLLGLSLIVVFTTLIIGGCSGGIKKENKKLKEEMKILQEQIKTIEAENATLNERIEILTKTVADLNSLVSSYHSELQILKSGSSATRPEDIESSIELRRRHTRE